MLDELRTTFSWKSARFEEEIKETETSANYIFIVIKHDFNFILSYNLTLMKHN